MFEPFPRELALRKVVALGKRPFYTNNDWYHNNCAELVTDYISANMGIATDMGWSCQAAVRTTFDKLEVDPCLAGSIRGMIALGWLNRRVNVHGGNALVNAWLFNEGDFFIEDTIRKLDNEVTSGWFEMTKTRLLRHLWNGHGFDLHTIAHMCNHASMIFNFVEYHCTQYDLSPLDRWHYVNQAWDVFVARKTVRTFYGFPLREPYSGFFVGYRDYVKATKNG
jgi:hypothetical protein